LNNELLLRNSHLMAPRRQTRLFAYVLKNDRATVDKSTCSDRSILSVMNWRMNTASAVASHWGLRWRRRLGTHGRNRERKEEQKSRKYPTTFAKAALFSTTGHGLNIADLQDYSSPVGVAGVELVSWRISSTSRSR